MSLHSTMRRLAVAVLAVSCVSLAFAFPQWRANLAHATGYSYLGCANKDPETDFNVFLSDPGAPHPDPALGTACDTALDTLLATCSLVKEDQFVTDKSPKFAALYRFFCPH